MRGNLGTVASPNQSTAYSYDTLNNLTQVVQGVQTRTFQYDSLSRLKQAANPESGTISYAYDANGNLTSKTDARSVVTTYAYDNLNRVKSRSYSDSTPQVSYVYDDPNITYAKGKLTKVSSSVSETKYDSFDNLGRMLTSQQITDGQTYNFAYAYNLSGMLTEETYPSGRKVKNTFATDGDLSKIETMPTGGSYATRADNFSYTAAGAVSTMQLGNSKWENAQFNSRLQPTQLGLGTSATDQSLWKVAYDYGTTDNNGNVKSQTITVPSITPLVQNYTYDSLNRIKSATETQNSSETWKQTFQYDRYGNRNFDAANTTTLGSCSTTQCNPSIDAANNRFTTNQGYTYDLSGNLLTDAQNRSFVYDAENKQKTVSDASGTIGTYFYDGDGKRVKKVSSVENTLFVYDASGKMIAEYLLTTATPQTATTSYLTTDALGSPRVITDQSGNITSRRDFMPFGEEIANLGNRTSANGYQSDSTRQKFTTYERDSESDLDFAQARMYFNKLGRFTSVDPGPYDPINPQVMNRYSYAVNSPLKYIDPDGRKIRLTRTAQVIEAARVYLQETSGLQLEVDKKGNLKVVGAIESKTASKDFATELSTILDNKKTATFNIVSEVESILVDDGSAASDENRNSNIDINDINQISKQAPELAAGLTIHALREGLELAKGNKYNAQSELLMSGVIRQISPSAHDIALESENRVMSGISGTTEERGRAPVVADRFNSSYDFKYTNVTYTVTLVVRGNEKDALTVTKKKN